MTMYCDMVNVKEFGARNDGIMDVTDTVQNAVDSIIDGGILYFPKGTYLITKSIVISSDNITMVGDGRQSKIIYTYEQQESDTIYTASLFSFREGISNVVVRDLKMEYVGSFFPNIGESYKGKVNGLCFAQCFDVLVERVEMSGFNSSAIALITGDCKKYAKSLKVDKCYLHHNRVAGVAYGYVEGVCITNCDLDYQGSILDGGTGYGCTGTSYEMPRYIQVKNNRARFNNRKGIDLHAGEQAIVEGNICEGNRLYGIYAEGPNTGDILIRGNIVSGMDFEHLGIAEPYTWINGISFGTWGEENSKEERYNYIVSENEIRDFGLQQGDAFPIYCYYCFVNGNIQVKNNIIKSSKITNAISFINTGIESISNVNISVFGNQIESKHITSYPIYTESFSKMDISHNQANVQKMDKSEFVRMNHFGKGQGIYVCNDISVENNAVISDITFGDGCNKNIKIMQYGNFLNEN